MPVDGEGLKIRHRHIPVSVSMTRAVKYQFTDMSEYLIFAFSEKKIFRRTEFFS